MLYFYGYRLFFIGKNFFWDISNGLEEMFIKVLKMLLEIYMDG